MPARRSAKPKIEGLDDRATPQLDRSDVVTEADDWGELLFRVHADSGWSLDRILDLTFPELSWWLGKGVLPKPKVTDARAIREAILKFQVIGTNEETPSG